MLAEYLRTAREAATLSVEAFAALAEVDPVRLQRAESGEPILEVAEVQRCAQILGLKFRDLLTGNIDRAPWALLFKGNQWENLRLRALAGTGVPAFLGEFRKCVKDVSDIEQSLGGNPYVRLNELIEGENWQQLWEHESDKVFPGEVVARLVRSRLELELEQPIPSMRSLLEKQLGVAIFWVTDEVLDREIDGASTRQPRPSILVNLVWGERKWWHTRMTLAHELAHLLFDLSERPTIFSPRANLDRGRIAERWEIFGGFNNIETRANAFAACFLAPEEAIRSLIGSQGLLPTSTEAVRLIAATFGIGRIVAINRLDAVFKLTSNDRIQLIQNREIWASTGFSDFVREEEIGLRTGVLPELVRQGLLHGRISREQAWESLDLPKTKDLPFKDLPMELRKPLISPIESIRSKAMRSLFGLSQKSLHVSNITRDGNRWHVEVVECGVGSADSNPVGSITLNENGLLIENRLNFGET